MLEEKVKEMWIIGSSTNRTGKKRDDPDSLLYFVDGLYRKNQKSVILRGKVDRRREDWFLPSSVNYGFT